MLQTGRVISPSVSLIHPFAKRRFCNLEVCREGLEFAAELDAFGVQGGRIDRSKA